MAFINTLKYDIIPVRLVDDDTGEVIAQYESARVAAQGNIHETARIAALCCTRAKARDGKRWERAVTDKERLERILEICVELEDETQLLEYLFRTNKLNKQNAPKLPEDIQRLLYFDWVWEKNRWWQPRIKALKKTYSRPILMIKADTGEVVKEYQSSKQCCEENGFRKGDVSLILSGKRRLKSINGYTFEYKKIKDRKRRDKELKEWKKGYRKQWKMKKC